MSELVRVEQPSSPPAPKRLLKERLLDGMQLTQSELARAIGISRPRLSMILTGRCRMSLEIALRIERVFGIPAGFWAAAIAEFELSQERQRISGELEKLPPLRICTDAGSSVRLLRSAS